MKGSNLGEFEELVLLMVGVLYADAYGVAIQTELGQQTGRQVKISAVHSALHRLEAKGYLVSELGGATASRGGRRKRLFRLTEAGRAVLIVRRDERNTLWDSMPKWALRGGLA